MFCGELTDHPRGTLHLNAMRIAEIYADDISFQSHVALNLVSFLKYYLPVIRYHLYACPQFDHLLKF